MSHPLAKLKGRGQTPKGVMNKLEARYASKLEEDPDILWWKYEGLTFRLAKRTTYTPDFLVLKKDLTIEVHETKGFWRDDARVKIKMAAKLFPIFQFYGIQWKGKKWVYESF